MMSGLQLLPRAMSGSMVMSVTCFETMDHWDVCVLGFPLRPWRYLTQDGTGDLCLGLSPTVAVICVDDHDLCYYKSQVLVRGLGCLLTPC